MAGATHQSQVSLVGRRSHGLRSVLRLTRLQDIAAAPARPSEVPHYHESWDEVAYGLAGTLTFQVDGRDVPVGRGASVFIRRGVVHGFRNDTQEPTICFSVLTPACLAPPISARSPPGPHGALTPLTPAPSPSPPAP